MKKLLLLTLSLFSVGFLAGCNTSTPEGYTDNDDKFRTFQFVRQLEDDEKKGIVDNVTNNIRNISSIKSDAESIVDNDNEKKNDTGKTEDYFYTDSRYQNNIINKIFYNGTESTTKNGITVNDSYTSTGYVWDTSTNSSAEKRTIAMRYETVRKDNSKVDVNCFDTTATSKEIKKSYFNQFLYNISDADAYEDSNGKFVFVKSEKKKTVTTIEYGDATRDEVKWEYTQKIYELSEDGTKLAKYTDYSRTKTNRDEETHDWYSDIKIVKSDYVVYSYYYDTRGSESIDTLNNSIKDHVSFNSIVGYAYEGTATGASRSADDITLTPASSSTEQSFTYVDKTSETNRVIEYAIHLEPYSGEPGSYSFANVAFKFTTTTRTGYQAEETSNYFINFNTKLPVELDDVIIKEYTSGDDKYYYLVNTSNKDVDLKVQMKLTASNYTIISCEVA